MVAAGKRRKLKSPRIGGQKQFTVQRTRHKEHVTPPSATRKPTVPSSAPSYNTDNKKLSPKGEQAGGLKTRVWRNYLNK